MAWDTEATKAKLLNAAISEFSERGFSGGRVQEISKKSGTNPERIYFYFGNKAKLFEAALTHELTTALEDLPINGQGPIAVADFAGRYFDFAVNHPSLARLTSWEGLERNSPAGARVRALQAANKVTEIQAALPGATVTQAEDLLLSIVTLCHAWVSSPNIHEVITGQLDLERRRRTIVRHTELMAGDTP